MLHQSIEAGCLESVIEDDPDRTRERLQKYMLDGELIEFHGQVSQLLDLINEEISRRGGMNRRAGDWSSVEDTGAMNIIRGTE